MHVLAVHVHVLDDGLAADLQVELGRLGQAAREVQRADTVVRVHGERVVSVTTHDGVARVVLEGGHGGQDLDDTHLGSCLFVFESQDDCLVLVGQGWLGGRRDGGRAVGGCPLENKRKPTL